MISIFTLTVFELSVFMLSISMLSVVMLGALVYTTTYHILAQNYNRKIAYNFDPRSQTCKMFYERN